MAANATANIIVRLRNLVSGPAKGIRAAFSKIGSDFSKLRGGFDLAGHVGMAAGAVNQLGAQARGALESIVSPALRFEDTMARVGALTKGATQKDLQKLTDTARELGRTTRFMAQEAGEGFSQLAIAGFNTKQQIAALPSILKLTQAAGTDLGRTADISSDLMGAFGKTAQDVGHINGVLAATFSNSTTTLETLFETFKLAAPIATKAGIEMEQTAILAGLLGNAGLKGSIGGTALRGTLVRLASPTKKSNKALRSLGVSASEIEKNFKKPAFLVKLLADGLAKKGIEDGPKKLALLEKIFGRRQAAGAGILIDSVNKIQENGRTAFENLSEGVYEAETALDRIATTMDSTGLAAVYKFRSAMESLKLDLARELTPVLGPLTKDLTKMVNQIAGWARANPELTRTIGKILLGTVAFSVVLGPLLLTLSSLISAFTVMRGILVTIVGPFRMVSAANQAMATHMKTSTGAAKGMTGAMRALNGAVGVVGAAFAGWTIGTTLDNLIGKVFKLREGLLSIELAHKVGESEALNKLVGDIGRTYGIKSLEEAAEKNQAVTDELRSRTQSEALEAIRRAEAEGLGINMEEAAKFFKKEGDVPTKPTQPAKVEGKITIEIDDKRTRVTKIDKSKDSPDMAVGYSSLGL